MSSSSAVKKTSAKKMSASAMRRSKRESAEKMISKPKRRSAASMKKSTERLSTSTMTLRPRIQCKLAASKAILEKAKQITESEDLVASTGASVQDVAEFKEKREEIMRFLKRIESEENTSEECQEIVTTLKRLVQLVNKKVYTDIKMDCVELSRSMHPFRAFFEKMGSTMLSLSPREIKSFVKNLSVADQERLMAIYTGLSKIYREMREEKHSMRDCVRMYAEMERIATGKSNELISPKEVDEMFLGED